MAKGSNKKVANSLMAASAAAVMAVYAAGYERTKDAASKLDAQFSQRRPVPADVRPVGETSARSISESGRPEPVNSDSGKPDSGKQAPGSSLSGIAQAVPAPDRIVRHEGAVEKESSPPSPVAVASSSPAPSAVTPPAPEPVAPVMQKSDTPVVASVAPTPVAPAVVPPAPAAAPTPAPADKPKYKDGVYTGWGTCRHGDIQAQVTIEGGKITVARISQCLTRYSCDVIGRLPPEVLQRQSAEVDWVSGATQSADAFYYAVTDALSKAR